MDARSRPSRPPEVHAKFDARVPYAFQFHSPTNTHIRFRGPCTFEAKLDHNGNLISYRTDRATCRFPNHPLSAVMPTHLPKTTCQPGATCYCSATFTIAVTDLPNSYEPLQWGTSNWAKVYYRRSLVETGNSQAQYHHREGSHTYRVLAPWVLMRLMFAIGLNVALMHAFMGVGVLAATVGGSGGSGAGSAGLGVMRGARAAWMCPGSSVCSRREAEPTPGQAGS